MNTKHKLYAWSLLCQKLGGFSRGLILTNAAIFYFGLLIFGIVAVDDDADPFNRDYPLAHHFIQFR